MRNIRKALAALIVVIIVMLIGSGIANAEQYRPERWIELDTNNNGVIDTILVKGAARVQAYDPRCGENLMACFRVGAAGKVHTAGLVVLGREFNRNDFSYLTDTLRTGGVTEDNLVRNMLASKEAKKLMALGCEDFVMKLGTNTFDMAYDLTWLIELQTDLLCHEDADRFTVAKNMIAVATYLGTTWPSFHEKVTALKSGWDTGNFNEVLDRITLSEHPCDIDWESKECEEQLEEEGYYGANDEFEQI